MRLILGVVTDFAAASVLAQQFLARSCTANQIICLTDRNISIEICDAYLMHSFYSVTSENSLDVWAMNDPALYSGGIRDNRQVKSCASACLFVINRYASDFLNRYRLGSAGAGKPIMVLRFSNSVRSVSPQIKALLKVAHGCVDIIDTPRFKPEGTTDTTGGLILIST